MRGLQTKLAPSFRLVRAHLDLGLLGLVTFSVALLWRAADVSGFFFQPLLLGLVHLCVLGWLLPIAIGALHQLVPVVFEVPVRSERAAWVAFALYALGAPLFITRMFLFDDGIALPIGATLVTAAVWLYVANLIATLVRSKQHSLTGWHVVAALFHLLVASSLGVLLAWNQHAPYLPVFHIALMRAHAHLAGFGFFGLLIMGIGYRLLEMYLLSSGAPERAGRVGLVASNLGVALLAVAFTWESCSFLLLPGVGAAGIGIGAFLLQVRAIHARRMQRRADVAWRHTLASLAYLGAAVLCGSLLAVVVLPSPWWDRAHLVYGLLALPGFMGSIVVGQLYKIVPFLVWLHRFSSFVGLKKIPSASELLPEGPKRLQYLLMHAGLAALALGLVADWPAARLAGAASFLASALLVVRNLAVVYRSKP